MNTVSVIIGIVCAVLMCVGLVPLFGWFNWFVLPGCVVGIIFGAISRKNAGLTINATVLAVAMLRLLLGGGIL